MGLGQKIGKVFNSGFKLGKKVVGSAMHLGVKGVQAARHVVRLAQMADKLSGGALGASPLGGAVLGAIGPGSGFDRALGVAEAFGNAVSVEAPKRVMTGQAPPAFSGVSSFATGPVVRAVPLPSNASEAQSLYAASVPRGDLVWQPVDWLDTLDPSL